MKPITEVHGGIIVVRDDLYPGGTKARYLAALFDGADELVYASPAEGGAQFAIATVAAALKKKATIFVAKRAAPHPRSLQVKALGGTVVQVSPGYLSVVKARAKAYAAASGARLLPWGVPAAVDAIAAAASLLKAPDEVWCAGGSGTLARALAKAWPEARRHVVQVGHKLESGDVSGAVVHVYDRPFSGVARSMPPFPADPHYEAKAWEMITARRGAGRILFWNVAGPATF